MGEVAEVCFAKEGCVLYIRFFHLTSQQLEQLLETIAQ